MDTKNLLQTVGESVTDIVHGWQDAIIGTTKATGEATAKAMNGTAKIAAASTTAAAKATRKASNASTKMMKEKTMPLKKGASRTTVSKNIKEMVDGWKEDGAIGTSKPASKKKAVKQATAIALKKAGKSKYQTGAVAKSAKGKAAKKSSTTASKKSATAKKGVAKKSAAKRSTVGKTKKTLSKR